MKVKPHISKLPSNDRLRVKRLINEIINDAALYPQLVDQIVIYLSLIHI